MSTAPPLLLTDWTGVRDSLTELAASHDHVARFLSDLFDQLDHLWNDLMRRQKAWQAEQEQARQELEARAEHLDQQRAELAVERERLREEAGRAMQEEMRRMEQEKTVLEQERVALETELEAVRTRAAEMAESLAQQGRQMAEERAAWSEELKRVRRVLESLVQQQAGQAVPQPASAARAAAPAPAQPVHAVQAARGPSDDPVLSSVMAQFDMLQKDLARRRNSDGG